METGRVVDVATDRACGSGYLVGPRLVLTALHVVADDVPGFAEASARPFPAPAVHEQIRVRLLDGTRWWDCRVRWPGGEAARWDAALLEVDDPDWTPPHGAVRWGRPTTTAPDLGCEVIGFPEAQRQPGGVREAEHVAGRISPATGARTGQLQILVPDAPEDEPRPWAGMSGAAVVCDGLVTAVVVEDAPEWGHHRLVALPVHPLLGDGAFRAAVRDGGEPPVESVELAPLLSAPPAPGPAVRPGLSPASMLRAEAEAVRFRGRSRELERMLAWCAPDGFAVRLLTGPGGQGKTRLARELMTRSQARGWVCGFLDADADVAEAGARLRRLTVPTLLTVDYAEARPRQIRDLVRVLGPYRGGVPLRLLLIARSAGDWWDELALQSDHGVRSLFRAAEVDVLLPLERSPAGRAKAYGEALTDLSARLARVRDGWRPPEVDPVPYLDFSHDRYGSALTIQMEALAYLLEPDRSHGGRSAADVILEHEEPYWASAARAQGIDLHPRTQRRVVAAASLCGADTEGQAVSFLARVPGLADRDEDSRLRVACWFRDLYPAAQPPEGAAFWGSLEPDRLAEHLVSTVIGTDRALLPALLRDLPPRPVHRALITLARAGLHDPAVARRIEELLVAVPGLAAPTVQAAPQSENPRPLVDALGRLVDTTPADERGLALFAELSDALPRQTRLFSRVAATVAQILVDVRRTLAAADPDAYLAELAQSLNTLANRLAGAGRDDEALTAAREAVAIWRRLSSADPDAHLPALAQSLVTLAGRSADGGGAIAEEAVELYRALTEADPEPHRPDLAESLNTLAVSLSRAGRWPEALARAREAAGIRRELASANPSAYLPDLAQSLNTMTVQLTTLGHGAEARDTAVRAASLHRALADADSDAHLAGLATSLLNLARTLAVLGEADAALDPARDGVVLRRGLADANPDAFAPALADSLLVLADLLAVTGWPKGARRVAAEAVRRCRRLAGNDEAHRPRLATALAVDAHVLARTENPEEATAQARKAYTHYQTLGVPHPATILTHVLLNANGPALPLLDALNTRSDALLTSAADELRKLHQHNPDQVEQTLQALAGPDADFPP